MYAVIRTGGKQYRVAPEDVIVIEKIQGDEGSIVQFADVLMVGGDGDPQVGAPTLTGASVAGEVVTQGRGDKILVFKKKRRKNYRRKRGHRQELTTVRITEILTGGKTPSKAKAAAKPAAKAEEKKPAETAKAEAKPATEKAEAKPKAEPKKTEAKKPATKKAEAKPKASAKPKAAAKKPAAKPKKDG